MSNFDIRKFLTENKLTDTSKRLDEKTKLSPDIKQSQWFHSRPRDTRRLILPMIGKEVYIDSEGKEYVSIAKDKSDAMLGRRIQVPKKFIE